MNPYRGSNWTGRAPRTLDAAFGPYTSQNVEPMPDHARDRVDGWCVPIVICIGAVALVWLAVGAI